MAILIDNQQKNYPIAIKEVQTTAQAILNALDCPEGELSILIVDDHRMAELNEAYLHHTGPTNVISFSMREGDYSDIHPELLGDVVISMDTCAREADHADIPHGKRFNQLLIHGILHLFGYDHVQSEQDAHVMDSKSIELMELIK